MSGTELRPSVLIAEDEPLLAGTLERVLRKAWPELDAIDIVHDGVAAVERALAATPDVLFLDIKMPGRSGLEAAEMVADEWPADRPAPLFVFVTAYDEFAVTAFEHAAVDYLLKPATGERIAVTVGRLREPLAARAAVPAAGDMAALFNRVQAISAPAQGTEERIRIIRASVGSTVRMMKPTRLPTAGSHSTSINVPMSRKVDGLGALKRITAPSVAKPSSVAITTCRRPEETIFIASLCAWPPGHLISPGSRGSCLPSRSGRTRHG